MLKGLTKLVSDSKEGRKDDIKRRRKVEKEVTRLGSDSKEPLKEDVDIKALEEVMEAKTEISETMADVLETKTEDGCYGNESRGYGTDR